jgi:D-alanine-D-alanine ligase-like ATP-grasp enzyme
MKKLLLIEHGGDAKSFIFDMIKDKDVVLFLATTYIPEWILTYIPEERILVTDTYSAEVLISTVQSYLNKNNIHLNAVGTFYEHVVVQTALLGEALGVIHLKPHAAKRSSANKQLMREAIRDAGLPTPRFLTLEHPTQDTLRTTLETFGFPAVIKPTFGSQSYGVKKIESHATLEEDIKEITNLTTQDFKEVFKNFTGTFLIEEYIPGKVVSVDGIVANSVIHIAGMVEFVMGPEPHFTQEANYIPARLSSDKENECYAMARHVIHALGFDNCGFHCEMRLTKSGPVLVEIAARLPGGPLQRGYEKAYGYNLASSLIDVWLGNTITLDSSPICYVLQKAVFPTTQGIIVSIEGVHNAQIQLGIFDFIQISYEGETTVIYPTIPKPYYYYALAATSKEELEQQSQSVEKNICVTLI